MPISDTGLQIGRSTRNSNRNQAPPGPNRNNNMATNATNVIIPPSIKVRDFSGDPKVDKEYDINQFCVEIEKIQRISTWDDPTTALYAVGFLTGPANTYVKSLEWDPDNKPNVALWSTLKPLLQARFKPKDLKDATDELTMKKTESFQDYRDRISLIRRMLDSDLQPATIASQDYKTTLMRDIRRIFLAGIDETTRNYLNDHFDDQPLEVLVTKAQKFSNNAQKNKNEEEKANSSKKNRQENADIAAMTDEEIEAKFIAEFNAWKKTSREKPFNFNPHRRGGRGRGRGGAQNNGGGPNRQKNVSELPWYEQLKRYQGYDENKVLCHNCWTFGAHIAADCNKPAKNKPAALSNYNPNLRKSQLNPKTANQAPISDGAQGGAGAAESDKIKDLETKLANMSNTMSSLLAARLQDRQQAPIGNDSLAFPLNFNTGL